jgi:hypothetical protein
MIRTSWAESSENKTYEDNSNPFEKTIESTSASTFILGPNNNKWLSTGSVGTIVWAQSCMDSDKLLSEMIRDFVWQSDNCDLSPYIDSDSQGWNAKMFQRDPSIDCRLMQCFAFVNCNCLMDWIVCGPQL